MTTSIATQRPNFHHITGTQPVGHTQIAVAGDYAGTITTVTRINANYWGVTVREVKGAFRSPKPGSSAHVWIDGETGQYVVDYWDRSRSVEAGRCSTLRAALGVAIDSAAWRGREQGLW